MDLNSRIRAIGSEHSGIRGAPILPSSPSMQMFRAALQTDAALRLEAERALGDVDGVPPERCVVSGKLREILRLGLGG